MMLKGDKIYTYCTIYKASFIIIFCLFKESGPFVQTFFIEKDSYMDTI